MKVFYISPSTIPSRSANLVHVLFMSEALTKLGHKVILFLHSDQFKSENEIEKHYDISKNEIDVVKYKGNFKRGKELGIAFHALIYFIKDVFNGSIPNSIISRNIYGAVFLGLVLRRRVIYETHTIEKGIRKYFQNSLIASNKIQTVVISHALKKFLLIDKLHLSDRVHVFHDAARAGRVNKDLVQRNEMKNKLVSSISSNNSYKKVIGYFGHLYPGRGVEVIEGLAERYPQYAFIVYGGNNKEIQLCVNNNLSENLFFLGYLNQSGVYEKMSMMDLLLMPYQKQVSIGIDSVDTSKWMSPMKMFEYMSASVPIISSDLPVLREVLVDYENCILVKPDDLDEWSNAIENLLDSPKLYKKTQ